MMWDFDFIKLCRNHGWRMIPVFNLHAHLLQGLLLNLPDAFAGDPQPFAHLFKGFWPAIVQTEPHGQNPAFPRVERGQNFPHQFVVVVFHNLVKRGSGVGIRHMFRDGR